MTDQTRAPITGVRTLGVPVVDQDRAIAFDVEELGLRRPAAAEIVEQP